MDDREKVIECLGSTIHNAEWANKITASCDVTFLKEIYAMLKAHGDYDWQTAVTNGWNRRGESERWMILISRAALLEDLSYCAPELWQDEEYIKAKIMKQPAVNAAPVVHGRWVDADGNPVAWSKAVPSSPEGSCVCSVCDTWLVGSDEYPVYGLFCPACGAKMDGERRDDDGKA